MARVLIRTTFPMLEYAKQIESFGDPKLISNLLEIVISHFEKEFNRVENPEKYFDELEED